MTHDEIVAELVKEFKELPPGPKQMFLETPREKLIQFHHGMGTAIRNKYNLWEIPWEPEIVNGIDMSPYHPDQVSMTLIERVWDELHAN